MSRRSRAVKRPIIPDPVYGSESVTKFVNTLMLQQVLARPQWAGRLNARDLHALTPLIWEHVNPYGRFDLDMDTRIAALI